MVSLDTALCEKNRSYMWVMCFLQHCVCPSIMNACSRTQTQNNQKIKHFTVMVPCANNSLSSASDALWLELYHNALCPPSVAVKHSLKRDAGTKVAPRALFFALI